MASLEDVEQLVAQFEAEDKALGKDGGELKKYIETCLRDE
jgi:hypothetical protein